MYALIENNTFKRWVTLKKDYPNISFPKIISQSDLPENVVIVSTPNLPTEGPYEIIERNPVPVFNDGSWRLQYTTRPMTNEEKQTELLRLAEDIRTQRNVKLEKSDWTQTVDSPVDRTAWAEYRQSLRDITEQEGFPLTVIWPEEPQ